MREDDKAGRDDTLADLNDTLAEMAEWDTAYKVRLQRKREQEEDQRNFPG